MKFGCIIDTADVALQSMPTHSTSPLDYAPSYKVVVLKYYILIKMCTAVYL